MFSVRIYIKYIFTKSFTSRFTYRWKISYFLISILHYSKCYSVFYFIFFQSNSTDAKKKKRVGEVVIKRSVIAGSAFPLNFSVKALYIWIRSCAFMSSVCQVKVISNQQKLHVMLLQKTKHQKTKTSAHNYGFWDTFRSPTSALSPTDIVQNHLQKLVKVCRRSVV